MMSGLPRRGTAGSPPYYPSGGGRDPERQRRSAGGWFLRGAGATRTGMVKGGRMAHVARRDAAWIARRGGTPALPQLVRLVFGVVCTRPDDGGIR